MFTRYRGMRQLTDNVPAVANGSLPILPPVQPGVAIITTNGSLPTMPPMAEAALREATGVTIPAARPHPRPILHPRIAMFLPEEDALVPDGEEPLAMDEMSRAIFEMDIEDSEVPNVNQFEFPRLNNSL